MQRGLESEPQELRIRRKLRTPFVFEGILDNGSVLTVRLSSPSNRDLPPNTPSAEHHVRTKAELREIDSFESASGLDIRAKLRLQNTIEAEYPTGDTWGDETVAPNLAAFSSGLNYEGLLENLKAKGFFSWELREAVRRTRPKLIRQGADIAELDMEINRRQNEISEFYGELPPEKT